MHDRRMAISTKLLRINFNDFEKLSRTEVVNGLSRNFEQVSQSLVSLLLGFQSVFLLFIMTGYLFWQSALAGFISLLFSAFLIVNYLGSSDELEAQMASTATADAALNGLANEVFSGFKELRLDPAKHAALAEEITASSSNATKLRAFTADLIAKLVTSSNSGSYVLAAAIIFVLPIVSSLPGSELSPILTTVLFIIGPIGGVIGAAQQLSTSQVALTRIKNFEKKLEAAAEVTPDAKAPEEFQSLRLQHASFAYDSTEEERGFEVKSIDLEVRPGEIIFITGGNGSGKTTALRVITGLYVASGGAIFLNGKAVQKADLASYRQLFSVVFSDFYVFGKPYGLDEEGLSELEKNLELFKIRDKLPADLALGYNPRALSTGQRKRLGLALAMAEQKPVIVLDEWAADQDPANRTQFYEQILPSLRAAGRAVIAITHDERYFSVADRRYQMDDMRLRSVD